MVNYDLWDANMICSDNKVTVIDLKEHFGETLFSILFALKASQSR